MREMELVDEIKFGFSCLESTVDEPDQAWQLLLRINTHFQILINGEIAYDEVDFPVVEFAAAAFTWLEDGQSDFLYTSMESEEEPLPHLGVARARS